MPWSCLLSQRLEAAIDVLAKALNEHEGSHLLRRGLHKTIYAGTSIALFTLGNLIKLVPYGLLAFARPSTLWAALALSPAVPVGVWVGKYLHDRLEQNRLFFWCYLLLIGAALKLLYDALRGLIA